MSEKQSSQGRLILRGLEAYGHHGDLLAERALGSHFVVDLELVTDTARVARTDRLKDGVNYVTVEALARQIIERRRYRLLETLAERLAAALLKLAGVQQVTVRVTKRPPLPHLQAFAVEVTREVTPKRPAR
jgi:dihydroneopterin aldolase